MTEWSEKWQIMFNFGKYKFLHTGNGIEDAQYTMGVLNTTVKEKGEMWCTRKISNNTALQINS